MVWYCNSECQKSDWLIHLVDCNPGRPITTADRLVAAVYSRSCPLDEATFQDYGFTQNLAPESFVMRAQVYHTLIVNLKVKAKTIDRWMEEGILDTMMRETFDAKLSPDERQQEVYLWFCNNQSTFGRGPAVSYTGPKPRALLDAQRAAWEYMGHNPSDPDETISATAPELSGDHPACFYLITMALGRISPYVGTRFGAQHPWISFGFCACIDIRREIELGGRYMKLFLRVSYDQFYQAHISSSLPTLFAENGLAIDNTFILDVLSSRNYKSVWFLKEFVCAEDEVARNLDAAPPIGADYGFSNCQNVDEVIALRNAYKQVFMRTDADPLALHEACLRGELFEYVGQLARLKPAQLFRRLMKNPYPV